VGKVIVFVAVIMGGFWVLMVHPPNVEELSARFRPFFHKGGGGLVQAMGYTFIALQGFDLIAAVGGEIKQPERTIPRAMLLSLGTALIIYLPLLFLVVAVGAPDGSIVAAAEKDPEILIAKAAGNFLGPTGYWLIIVAGLLSMLSALQANLMAASHFAKTMATDRTLPRRFGRMAPTSGTPVPAIMLTAITVTFILIALPDVATAGAMSSLIFLSSFALIHGLAYLVQRRDGVNHFQSAAFPLIPVIGGAACLALALFQSVAVPSAGALAAMWLGLGALLYMIYLAPGAKIADASAEALDPSLVRFRGRSPLVLVPIANPASAPMLVTMADALIPHAVAKILLLSVVRPPQDWSGERLPAQLVDAQKVLGGALATAFKASLNTEALITMGENPWLEIERVANRYRCESLILGFGKLDESLLTGSLETLMSRVEGDVKIVRAPMAWKVGDAQKILVAAGGRRDQSRIRAHLIGNMCRTRLREITYLRVLPAASSPAEKLRAKQELAKLAADEAPGISTTHVVCSDDMISVITAKAAESDLLVLGLQRLGRRNKVFGKLVLKIADRTTCPLLMISQRR
jgi:nucleotide-binding universal stress UspA family protein